MKYTLHLINQSFPFVCPVSAELSPDQVLLNDVILPKAIDNKNSFNPHNVRLWVIGHEHGAICAVWASNAQDALDNAVDANLLDGLMVDDQSDMNNEEYTPLGNASELFDLSYAWIGEVQFDATRDIQLIIDIVRGSERGLNDLGDL